MATPTKISRKAQVMESLCVACGCCVKVCPMKAISIYKGIKAVVIRSCASAAANAQKSVQHR